MEKWTSKGLEPDVVEALERRLPATRLWSLLMGVMERRAAGRTPAQLMEQWTRDGFTGPCDVDQRTLNALDGHLLAVASDFEAVELSPVAPLGVCSAAGLASQNKILSALRGTEVVSDPTNVLALESATRLKQDATRLVRLATSHRCLRAQELPKQPGFAPHFRIFCLTTAGREQQGHAQTEASLVEQITTWLHALDWLEQHGYAFPDRRVRIFAVPDRSAVADRVASRIAGPPIARDLLEHPYYNGGIRFQIDARSTRGAVPLIDGGTFDWVATLASNSRLIFVASGMGSQLAACLYRSPDAYGSGTKR